MKRILTHTPVTLLALVSSFVEIALAPAVDWEERKEVGHLPALYLTHNRPPLGGSWLSISGTITQKG